MNKTVLFFALIFSTFAAQAEISEADKEIISQFGSSLRAVRVIDLYPRVVNDFSEATPPAVPRLAPADFCFEFGKVVAQMNMLGDAWGTGKFEVDLGNDEAWLMSLNVRKIVSQVQSELNYLSGYCSQKRNPKYSVGYQNHKAFGEGFVKWTDTFIELFLTLEYDAVGKYRLESAEAIKEYWLSGAP